MPPLLVPSVLESTAQSAKLSWAQRLGISNGFLCWLFWGRQLGAGWGRRALVLFFLHSKFLFPDAYRGENRSLKSSSIKYDSVEGEPVGLALSVCQFCFFPLRYAVTLLLQAAACKFLDSCQPVQTQRFLPEEAAARYVRVRSRGADPLDLLNSSR